jgi:hypothetical protein
MASLWRRKPQTYLHVSGVGQSSAEPTVCYSVAPRSPHRARGRRTGTAKHLLRIDLRTIPHDYPPICYSPAHLVRNQLRAKASPPR